MTNRLPFSRSWILALTLAAACGSALAQGAASPGQGPNAAPEDRVSRQLQHMTAELGLTQAQQDQLRPILLERAQKVEALRGNTADRGRQQRSEMRKLAESYQERIDAVLTPDQKTKAEAMRAEARSKARGAARQRRGTGAPAAPEPPPPAPN